MQVGFCGAGNMAMALARAIVRDTGDIDVRAFDVSEERIQAFRSTFPNFIAAASNREVADSSDVTVLAVKPQIIGAVLQEIRHTDGLIVSIAAGVTIGRIEAALPAARVVRVMPNAPCLVGAMAAGYALGSLITEADAELVQRLLASAGEAVLLDERLLDAVTGLSGSGPAFVARLIEAFAEAGRSVGLTAETAMRLTLATFAGTAKLLAETGMTPEELVTMVSSPGGTTVAGRDVLEGSDYREVILAAVRRAAERSRELGA